MYDVILIPQTREKNLGPFPARFPWMKSEIFPAFA